MAEPLRLVIAESTEEELWRRAEDRREAQLALGLTSFDQSLLALVMSMARLAAQREARSSDQRKWSSLTSAENV